MVTRTALLSLMLSVLLGCQTEEDGTPDPDTSATETSDVVSEGDTQPQDSGMPDTGTTSGTDTGTSGDVAPEVTWDTTMEAFFATYCVGCHSASPKDFTVLDEVKDWADPIRCGVAPSPQEGCGSWPPPKQFPVGDGPKPTDAERQVLVDWIDAGMP